MRHGIPSWKSCLIESLVSKRIRRFGVREKLSLQFIGPFEVLERVESVAYRIALPPWLVEIHDVFHVSALRKHVFDPSYVINFTLLEVGEDLRSHGVELASGAYRTPFISVQ
uniref:Tf2-1-like SH3-like domain-containing protein n=1 Tax=Ananas comosus var. bracteatus TaxID=296719 RepID=A0A6V7NHY8_ANACO|nr:unnamed protein product [Ananas comosus var. bracteatus]